MANINKIKGTIGILTGGGDVPGLNPAIRAVTVRALREGYRVLGIRRGWAGLVEIDRDQKNGSDFVMNLTEEVVNKVGRTGGTFLHSSRTRPSHVPKTAVPDHLRDSFSGETNDLTKEVLANIEHLGIDTLIPIGGKSTGTGAMAALPIWTQVVRAAMAGRPAREFEIPAGLVHVQTCLESGQLATPDCPQVIDDLFLPGTEPDESCTIHRQETAPLGDFKEVDRRRTPRDRWEDPAPH